MVPSMIGNPTRKKAQKLMGYPAFLAMSTMTTFALAPITVPFPPRQAPRARAHHSGRMSG